MTDVAFTLEVIAYCAICWVLALVDLARHPIHVPYWVEDSYSYRTARRQERGVYVLLSPALTPGMIAAWCFGRLASAIGR